jgi:hypothetical protein
VQEAVAVYRVFGLSLDALFALFRVVVTAAIVIFTLRIPFKRNYHWAFLAWNFSFLWGTGFAFLAQSSTTAAAALSWYHPFQFFGQSAIQVLLAYQFVIYFISPKPARWQKYLLIGGYVWTAALLWVPGFIDPSFLVTTPHLTQFGWTTGPGLDAPYVVPGGVDYFFTAMVVIIFYLLLQHYRSERSSLKKGQTKYIIVGTFFIIIGTYQHYIASYIGAQNIPILQNLISAPGDLISLFGLRRKGFYSAAPVAETATISKPIKYDLEDGRTYLAQDPKGAFESFSYLVRSGRQGLMITRTFPEAVRKDYGIQTTPIRWLAETKGADAIPPGDLLGLSVTVKEFMEKATNPVVMLHGIEYLTTYDGFTPVLKLIQGLSEANAMEQGILILPVTPKSLDERDEALLASETTPLPTPVTGGQ